jgi:hypothetical protein
MTATHRNSWKDASEASWGAYGGHLSNGWSAKHGFDHRWDNDFDRHGGRAPWKDHGDCASKFSIRDPDSVVYGQTIAEWTEDWWTAVASSPAGQNIVEDDSGQYAHVNNDEKMFFVGGTLGPAGDVERTFSVEAGRDLLIPIVNIFDSEGPGITSPEFGTDYEGAVDEFLDNWEDAIDYSSLHLTIDGKTFSGDFLEDYLVRTDIFSLGEVQKDSYFASLGAPVGTDASTTGATGIWVVLHGLEKGKHTISFGGDVDPVVDNDDNVILDPGPISVTDHIYII